MHTLDPISLPLNRSCLIEASAGTGKTYTMVNLYLRLLLGVGCEPLTVEQILVVTFTKAATQELRDRIRQKVAEVGQQFAKYHRGEANTLTQDAFLFALYQAVAPHLHEALLRLRLAEREIDLASIFTIDSFCQKMLYQFAFESGIRFDMELQTDESELLTRLSQETWRTLFYPLNFAETTVVAKVLGTPEKALNAVEDYLYGIQPEPQAADRQWLDGSFSDFYQRYQAFIQAAKAHWQSEGERLPQLIETELTRTYPAGKKKALNRKSYQQRWLTGWKRQMNEWAEGNSLELPQSFYRFCQETLTSLAEEGATPLSDAGFAKNQHILTAYQQQFEGKLNPLLHYHFLRHLQARLLAYKSEHKTKSFGDILTFLHHALHAEQGEQLAAQIRARFPFAMVDEFQDTNQQQYDIFRQIFMAENQGFVLIGDPKQSIYKFRGADIFTYLSAAEQVQLRATLNRNWRSLPEVVASTNQLFQFPPESAAQPFLYQGIPFQPVLANTPDVQLIGQANTRYYLSSDWDEQRAATLCADQIQQQLKAIAEGQLFLQKSGKPQPLAAQDIAVLVRSHNQAMLIRQALQHRHIQSVFFSERNSVYESQEATDLRFILRACLHPYQPKALLTALGTPCWGLTADQIFQLKQHENEWDHWVETFVHYQQVWQQQGILPMLHQMWVQQGIIQRINASPNADRRITDLLHLAELLQGKMPDLENEAALLRWYEEQLAHPNGRNEEQTLRLESEQNLVKIITIHGAKGLEYPLVWLPFVGKASKTPQATPLAIYRDEHQQPQWHFGAFNDNVKNQFITAEFAEDLRLLYVAITRAKYQINLILPDTFDDKKWTPIQHLLCNGQTNDPRTTADLLRQKGIDADIILQATPAQDDWQPPAPHLAEVQASLFQGVIKTAGQVTSFTALQAQNERLQQLGKHAPLVSLSDDAKDDDRYAFEPIGDHTEDDEHAYHPSRFPHSTKVGNVLHRFFEQHDFTQAVTLAQLHPICEQLALDDAWLEPLQQWFERILTTPFGDQPFCLRQITPAQRLNEWQFYLRLKQPTALPQLNQLLKQHSPLAASLPDLQLTQLNGYVRGFIDCIAQVGNQFYVIDYKSNFLGTQPQDYGLERLTKTIGQFRYDLQYLLYTLAVHRYLRSRLGQAYDYERDFGGVAYLFLRGMDGTAQSGVYLEKPSAALITALDQLFG